MVARRRDDEATTLPVIGGLPTGEAPLVTGPMVERNPLLGTLPTEWSPPKSDALIEAEATMTRLNAELDSISSDYEVAVDARDPQRMAELRVRNEILPDLIQSADAVYTRERLAWLAEVQALVRPHVVRNNERLEQLFAQREELNARIEDVREVGAWLGSATEVAAIEYGVLHRRQLAQQRQDRAALHVPTRGSSRRVSLVAS